MSNINPIDEILELKCKLIELELKNNKNVSVNCWKYIKDIYIYPQLNMFDEHTQNQIAFAIGTLIKNSLNIKHMSHVDASKFNDIRIMAHKFVDAMNLNQVDTDNVQN